MSDEGGKEIWDLDTFSKFKTLPFYLQLNPEIPVFEKYRLWYELVKEYSPRQFTCIQDRLVAVSGLAKQFGSIIKDDQYVAGLWKRDLLRGLLWHVRGAKLIPSKKTDGNLVPGIPSWSWASVANELIVNDHARQDGLRSFAVIDDVLVDLVDGQNPFGAVRSGRITITGPVFLFSRLYNKDWRDKKMPMSAFERYVSKVVEQESREEVEERFSSSHGGFAALQILQRFPSDYWNLDLLLLESTNKAPSGIVAHRRLGVLTLQHTNQGANSSLLQRIKASKRSLRSQLGENLHQPSNATPPAEAAFKELAMNPWPRQTVVIV
jgi:hypothetical protein